MTKKRKSQQKKDLIKVTHEPHKLPCQLDATGRFAAAVELGTAIERLEGLEGERKAAAAAFKGTMDGIKQTIHTLSLKVTNSEELRSVDCELRLNHTKLTAILVRTDTQEIVEDRPMTDEERQMALDFGED